MKNFFETKPVLFTTGSAQPHLLEDTIRNFRNAVSLGSDVIRTNIFLTRDKKIIAVSDSVYYDKELMKAGIASCSLEQLRVRHQESAAPGSAGEGDEAVFPEIMHLLEAFPHQRFNFDLNDKSIDLVHEFCTTLAWMNAFDRVLVSSFNGRAIKVMRRENPEIAASFSFSGIIGFYALFKSGLLDCANKFKADALIIAEMIGASYIANAGLIRKAQLRGIPVYVLDVNSEEKARRLKEIGVDGFITNDIDMIKKVIG